ncbi:MAG: hypothetical protein ACE5PV_04700 [Candidatus Poribacteria bacterium]
MDKSIASRLEKKFGADVVEDLDLWVRGIVSDEAATKDQFGQIISRFDSVESRLDVLDERTQNLTNEITSFRAEVNERFLSIDQRFLSIDQRLDTINERIVSSIKWTVGTIALFGTIITVLMAVFKFVP